MLLLLLEICFYLPSFCHCFIETLLRFWGNRNLLKEEWEIGQNKEDNCGTDSAVNLGLEVITSSKAHAICGGWKVFTCAVLCTSNDLTHLKLV